MPFALEISHSVLVEQEEEKEISTERTQGRGQQARAVC